MIIVKNQDKIQNVVKLLSSLGVNIKKTKSRLDIINTLPTSNQVSHELK
ncbi:hypothetical protein M459_0202420 [Staphylococcus epidermidis Scl25]|uniref:Uncharacterized protein n=1 Tax=Staphylococcus epidermidis (strain ATCC 12228 / FDA PCI 1200) TaxID=176280 RepID=A0A0H2VHK0_STAES|nr:conserved hypothetical protein [Staphylococcus epidermidis ATCC 12228]APT15852.1 hypothetical protein BUM85_02475 [Staphylococcus epidermidis]ESR04697.1 hypothetical protein M462_0202895 [Staphylococcus epidermidis CIM28]ESR27716.1 hypothetical protein M452_0202735 [Staphylococcus epidermidis APO35]EST93861.1 hypothetical protein M460_0209745 [Staphylococcus epidermidis Scl31]EST99761.1 hypothetical protein M459_0202420 [Staphylococcus epidermidis Scl25]ESU04595.1 hypothetical protein M461